MLNGLFDLPLGGTPKLAHCTRCHKPPTEVGELRIYPPIERAAHTILQAAGGLPGVGWFCGSCAVYKAVYDTTQDTERRRYRYARGSSAIN